MKPSDLTPAAVAVPETKQPRVWPTLEVILIESPAHLRKRLDPESGRALIRPRARSG
jgi:hypothetical protein